MRLLIAYNVADKVMKEKNELRDLNSQLTFHINDLNTSLCALKEILTSCNLRANYYKSNTESHSETG